MKCSKCGFENKYKAKFCTKCGSSLVVAVGESEPKRNNSRYLIIALIVVIIILAGTIGYFVLGNPSHTVQNDDNLQSADSDESQSVDSSNGEKYSRDASEKTKPISSSKTESKDWVSIGSYSGSGSGSETISVPEGKIMVKLSAYPIKNYATNHLYVTGSSGDSGGVDWGSKSAVKTKSDSFTYESSSEEVFTIDYYETVDWQVEFFRYQ
ncbi:MULTISPECIES: zinc ribbon domain-containing protein [unclassified Methanobrevibacter]|uniref:zinc ribbon domain-containing protein n=1 Tax=unclassified Methanobrevibacter TaxID=2638681 RepID=UPI0027358B96|nr:MULTISPECIES: zinc ribbon domain-containing protein [unclassified Methanobrevibacter]